MTTTRRIPTGLPAFSIYLEKILDYLLAGAPTTNAARLGVEDEEVQFISGIRDEWDLLFPLYIDKRGTRTLLITEQLNVLVKRFSDYNRARRILDRIAASANVTVADLTIFNIKGGPLAKQTRTKLTIPLAALVIPDIKQMGGGMLSIKCYNNLDTSRGLIEDADSVECRYLIGDLLPESANAEELKSFFSTKANFKLLLGAETGGKKVHIFFRWYNGKYPALAGPWSQLYTVFVV